MKGVKRSLIIPKNCFRLHTRESWGVAGFSDRTPYPMGKRSEGCGGKACRGRLLLVSLERFSLEGLGLQFYFSFQTPIRASEFMSGATI